ncbi:MAG: ABC transporter permease [bacterium]|nr:ABC transporter permease [bacterium]
MLSNYLKVLSRNVWKNKFFSILNIAGLAIGMTCYLLIFKYAAFELSYDDFHENRDNIYRLQRDLYENNALKTSMAKTSFNIGPAMKAEFPEVEEVARCADFPSNTVSYLLEVFRDEKITVTESSFFKVFSFPLLKGDPQTALDNPNSILISQSAAGKYFGDQDPMGKNIRITTKGREYSCQINGVFADVPENSLLQFDFLLSLRTIWNSSFSDWIYSVFHNYYLLTPGADSHALEAKFPAFIDTYVLQHVPRAAGWKLLMQPLKDIYLYSDIAYDTKNGNGEAVYFLLIIAFLVLVISWINYVNLSTARAMERAREVGMRKVLGSSRVQLIRQFLAESLLVNIFPIIIAVILFALFLPFLRGLTGKGIPLSYGEPWFWLNLLGLYTAGSLLSGLYPAFVLSSFKPVTVLKRSKLSRTTGGALLRKILVVFQFAAAAVLIIVTFGVYRQIQFMRSKDLGINIDRVMAVRLPSTPVDQQYIENVGAVKTEWSRYPGIQAITGSSIIPGSVPAFQRLSWKENTDFKTGKILSLALVDYDFFPTYQLDLAAGRNFSKDFGTDTTEAVILNEAALKLLGLGEPPGAVGQKIAIYGLGARFKIIGAVKNYHQQSLKKNYDPLAFLLRPNVKNFYSLKLAPGNTGETLGMVKQKWDEVFPGFPLDYFFLDDHFDNQYKADRQFGKVLGIFVLLAVIITCLGLLGLSYFSTNQRTKEIGIRKVHGAGIQSILFLLSKDIVKLIVIAVVAAWPAAYWILNGWLKNYAHRIPVPLLFFILSGLLVTVISLLTTAYHTAAAARANPIDALREE